jgi:hypothetical protein
MRYGRRKQKKTDLHSLGHGHSDQLGLHVPTSRTLSLLSVVASHELLEGLRERKTSHERKGRGGVSDAIKVQHCKVGLTDMAAAVPMLSLLI